MSDTVRLTWRRKLAIWWHWKRTGHRFVPQGFGDFICHDCPWGTRPGWYFIRPGYWQSFPPTPEKLGAPPDGESPK